jgi:hypothetical protein
MKTEQIIILVVAFAIGMLLLNVVKNMCGCELKEGFYNDADAKEFSNKLEENCPIEDFKGGGSGSTFHNALTMGTCGPLGYPRRGQKFTFTGGNRNNLFTDSNDCGYAYRAIQKCDSCGVRGVDITDLREGQKDHILNGCPAADSGAGPPSASPCSTNYPEQGVLSPTGFAYEDAVDGVPDLTCADGYVEDTPQWTCAPGAVQWSATGCNPGCGEVNQQDRGDCTATSGALGGWDPTQSCDGDLGECTTDTCCTAFDSTKWDQDDRLLGLLGSVYNMETTSSESALAASCPPPSSTNPIPGCDFPFVYSSTDINGGCTLATPAQLATGSSLYSLRSSPNFTLCRPADSVTLAALSCTTLAAR